MYDVVTVGGATQDIFFIDQAFDISEAEVCFPWGEKFVVDDMLIDIGGGACNSAVGFARLGLRTALWCEIGADTAGRKVIERLREEGIDNSFLIQAQGSTSTSVILLEKGGEHSIVMYRGKHDNLDPEQIDWKQFLDTKWVYVAELTGDSTPLGELVLEKAKAAGVKFVFLPGRGQLEAGVETITKILKDTDVFILNASEAAQILGYEEEKFMPEDRGCAELKDEIEEMLVALREMGPEMVVITRDLCGVNAFDGKEMYECPAPGVKERVDTTGAGDAFASGFVAALVYEKSVEEALKWGTQNSGAVIENIGAQTGLLKKGQLVS